MLPFIELRLPDYCTVAFNYCLGLFLPVARNLWFDRRKIIWAGKALQLNFDEYLTAHLATYFLEGNHASRTLVFYGAIQERFALSLCSAEQGDLANTRTLATAMPGCLDRRADFILQTAAPFLLFDGRTVCRLHHLDEPDRTSFYVWDFGDLLGNFLKKVDKSFYFRILNDKDTYYEYAVVPKNPVTHIQYGNRAIPVHHAFCRPLY